MTQPLELADDLRRGHATLFGRILAWAPQTELDRGSRRTLQTLREGGASPDADDAAEPSPDPMTGSHPPTADQRRAEP